MSSPVGWRPWFTRTRESIIPWLAIAACVLLLANLSRRGVIAFATLKANKDALSALQSVVQSSVVLLAGIMSYYRFFRGRTFVKRADLLVDVQVISTPPTVNIHCITADLKNIGTLTIWHPEVTIVTYVLYPDESRWAAIPARVVAADEAAAVDSGETSGFTGYIEVPKEAWCVNYQITISDADGFKWSKSVIVSNAASKLAA